MAQFNITITEELLHGLFLSIKSKFWECKYFCVWELLAPFWCCLLCRFNLVTISFIHYYCYLLFIFYA